MKKFDHPKEPDWPFEGAHPPHGNGGWAARSWSNYSVLSIREAAALSLGLNPLTNNVFEEYKNRKYGTLQIGIWQDRVTEIHRAILANEIRTLEPITASTKITYNTAIYGKDVGIYFKNRNTQEEKNDINQPKNPSTEVQNFYRIINETYSQFWENIDPNKPPKSDEIVKWIQDKFQLAKRNAETIDTMIRPKEYRQGGNRKICTTKG